VNYVRVWPIQGLDSVMPQGDLRSYIAKQRQCHTVSDTIHICQLAKA
jgi:hypothetical protein